MDDRSELLAPFSPIETSRSGIDADKHQEDIALSAYRRAEARGFAPGGEMEDWLAAEREIAARGVEK